MTRRHRERIRACFALARDESTTQGERDNALAMGNKLIEQYGMNPDDFDIPGREKVIRREHDDSSRLRHPSEAPDDWEHVSSYSFYHEFGCRNSEPPRRRPFFGADFGSEPAQDIPIFTTEDIVRQAMELSIRRRTLAHNLPDWYWYEEGTFMCKHGPVESGLSRCPLCENERKIHVGTFRTT